MKALLALFLCFSFLGFSETSQASGQIVDPSSKESIMKLCYEENNYPTCILLGYLEEAEGNLVAGAASYKKACEGGYLDGCMLLGFLEEDRGNYDEALASYKKACDAGDSEVCIDFQKLKRKIEEEQRS